MYKCAYVSLQCHAGTRARPRGRATWPCMPRRIHVGSRDKCTHFCIYLYYFKRLKIENKVK